MSFSRRPAGFTLIEAVMVILIVGVLAISIAPRFASLSTYDARVWSDDLRQVLRHARQLAAWRGCPVRVDVGAAGYAVWNDAECRPGVSPRFSLPVLTTLDREPMRRPLPDGMTLTPLSLVFAPGGSVTEVSGSGMKDEFRIDAGGHPLVLSAATGRLQ